MNYEDIYHVEQLPISKTDLLNEYLQHGWKLLSIIQHSDLDLAASSVISYGQFIVGCSKEVFELHKVAIQDSSEDYPF